MSVDLRSAGIVTSLLILLLELSVTVFTNVFIAYSILHHYCKKKTMNTGTKIRVALNMSCIVFIMVKSYTLICDIMSESCKTQLSDAILLLLTIYNMCYSAWLAALLCFFYCTKVVDCKTKFFSWAKKNINSSISYIILVVKLLSLSNSFLTMLIFYPSQTSSTNTSFIAPPNERVEAATINSFIAKIILGLIFLPFVTMTITTLVTVRFLRLHNQNMEKNMKPSSNKTQKRYKSVASKMMSFLCLYAAFYTVSFLYYFLFSSSLHNPGYWVLMILMFLFTPTQSMIIILGNPNLRKLWKIMIDSVTCSQRSIN